MEAVKEAHGGKMVALAAGLSVGVTIGYIVYRHISSTSSSKFGMRLSFLLGYNQSLTLCLLL